MTYRWLIFFSACFGTCLALRAGSVTGSVELRDSNDVAVRKNHDYSGVVISLKPIGLVPAVSPRKATMLQKNKTFTPHVLAVTVDSAVDFPNADPIFHNAFSSYSGQIFDVGLYPPGTNRSVRFKREGVVRVFCNIHSSMSAVIVVLSTPYYAASKADGSFEISNVPPGEYEATFFHERSTEDALKDIKRRINVTEMTTGIGMVPVSEAGYLSIPHHNKFGHEYGPEAGNDPGYPGMRR